jgi:hypothetical protein
MFPEFHFEVVSEKLGYKSIDRLKKNNFET